MVIYGTDAKTTIMTKQLLLNYQGAHLLSGCDLEIVQLNVPCQFIAKQ